MPSLSDFLFAAVIVFPVFGCLWWVSGWYDKRCIKKTVEDIMKDIKEASDKGE